MTIDQRLDEFATGLDELYKRTDKHTQDLIDILKLMETHAKISDKLNSTINVMQEEIMMLHKSVTGLTGCIELIEQRLPKG